MICVVCGAAVEKGQARYANAWEETLKKHPCCSERCCRSFNVDEHWLPGAMPQLPAIEEVQRLIEIADKRLTEGDRPRAVVREMLLAGLPPHELRKLMVYSASAAEESHGTARGLNVIGSVVALFSGVLTLFQSTDKREPAAFEEAHEDLARWEVWFSRPADEQADGKPR